MKKPRVPNLTPATWIALAALFVSLAAPPAAFALGKASVGTWHLKNGAVTSAKIRDANVKARDLRRGAVRRGKVAPDAVDSTKVEDGSVSSADLAANSVNTWKVAPNSLVGADINEATLKISTVVRTTADPTPGAASIARATCPSGYRAVGGGARDTRGGALVRSIPHPQGSNTPTGWEAVSSAVFTDSAQVETYVVCAKP